MIYLDFSENDGSEEIAAEDAMCAGEDVDLLEIDECIVLSKYKDSIEEFYRTSKYFYTKTEIGASCNEIRVDDYVEKIKVLALAILLLGCNSTAVSEKETIYTNKKQQV